MFQKMMLLMSRLGGLKINMTVILACEDILYKYSLLPYIYFYKNPSGVLRVISVHFCPLKFHNIYVKHANLFFREILS